MKKQTLPAYSGAMIIRGILAILFGLLALFMPGLTLELLVFLFAFYALFDGFLGIVASITAMSHHQQWWVFLLEGILGLAVGVAALVWPGITMVILLYLIAAWAVLTGLMELFGAIAVPFDAGTRWLIGIAGVLSLFLGILMFVYPITSLFILVLFVGIYALLFGALLVIFGIRVKLAK